MLLNYMIELSNFSKSYNHSDFAAADVSLKIADGSITGLLGPNGSGKTTIMKAICGFHFPTSGSITISLPDGNSKTIRADLLMEPFDVVKEDIEITKSSEAILYSAVNTNKLRYLDKFDCIWPKKMKICILLFRDGDNWVLYGLGGVTAPRVPFFTERIQTSFINRINTFCSFIFKKF